MSTTSLLNLPVNITISDPWEFGTECGPGPFDGTITDATSDRLIVRLLSPVVYRGKTLKSAVARPRRAGDLPATVAFRALAANLILLPVDVQVAAQVDTGTTRDGVAAVGTVTRSP